MNPPPPANDDAAAASSPPAHSPSPLTRLPSVLAQLVMQSLSLQSLARLASTCRLMRADALHPSAGRYVIAGSAHVVSLLPPPSAAEYAEASPRARVWLRAQLAAHSPLGRAHLRVTLSTDVVSGVGESLTAGRHSQLMAALTDKAAGWARIEALAVSAESAPLWTEDDALTLLQSPALQRLRSMDAARGAWLSEPVLTALCRLPHLSALTVHLPGDARPSARLHPAAFAHATGLRSLVVQSDAPLSHQLAGLVCAPRALVSLRVLGGGWGGADAGLSQTLMWLRRYCRPILGQLRVVQLSNLGLFALPPSALRGFLRALPQLRYLQTDRWQPQLMLRGLVEAADSLPDLRVVSCLENQLDLSDASLVVTWLRRFLCAHPRARFCLQLQSLRPPVEFGRMPRLCITNVHAQPNLDGDCGECVCTGMNDRSPRSGSEAELRLAVAEDVWTEVPDAASGRSYFFNKRSRATAWINPEPPIGDEEPEPELLSADDAMRIVEAQYAAALQARGLDEAAPRD